MIYSANVQGYVILSLTPPYHAYILLIYFIYNDVITIKRPGRKGWTELPFFFALSVDPTSAHFNRSSA